MSENDEIDIEESSLDDFEEEFLREQKSATKKRMFLLVFVVLIGFSFVGVAWKLGFVHIGFMDSFMAQQEAKIDKENAAIQIPMDEAEFVDEFEDELATVDKHQVPDAPASYSADEPTVAVIPKTETVLQPAAAKKAAPKVAKAEVRQTNVVPVTIMPAKNPCSGSYYMQLGIFADVSNVSKLRKKLSSLGLSPTVEATVATATRVRVLAGSYPFRELALKDAERLMKRGYKPRVKIVSAGEYALDMGLFSEVEAKRVNKRLFDKGIKSKTKVSRGEVKASVVTIRNIMGSSELQRIKELLKNNGIDYIVKR